DGFLVCMEGQSLRPELLLQRINETGIRAFQQRTVHGQARRAGKKEKINMQRIIFAALLGFSGATLAEGGMLQKDCSACHNITGPAAQTLKDAFAKKGPDLFYAGNKYRQEWLVSWLQMPGRIRPAGIYYGDHIKAGVKSEQ